MDEFQVEGMTCGHCARAVTQAVQEVDKDAKVEVELASGTVKVESGADRGRIVAALAEAGYPVRGG